ncbi:hypothetical protein LCGC14_1384080 [marine sediment metagenome]|uniref:Uncharacterized protein n=1 Tax=marine sediment metagenome TaxID=412755 RepID=A0A0F9K225_9ZZZZ
MIEQLKDQIKVVVLARQTAITLKTQRDISLEAWNKTNQGLLDALTQAGAEVAEVEATLRELTLKAYDETGDKTPVAGVGIREVTRLEYDKTVAFKWATEHVMALKLDTTAFEKIAKASPLDFVMIYQEPMATIATQLEAV